jgi:hypothetical protein
LFAVRTPTALVEDLGTEFGVEVLQSGETASHVFEGKIVMRVSGPAHKTPESPNPRTPNPEIILTAGQSARIDADGKHLVNIHCNQKQFVRRLTAELDIRAEQQYIKTVLADRPVGYWPLNQPPRSRKFNDLSGNGLHGWARGEVRPGLPGPLPGSSFAVGFDGNGYIDLGRQDRLALANGFSVECWVFMEGDFWHGAEPRHARIFSVGDSSNRYQQTGWALGFFHRSDAALPVGTLALYGVAGPTLDGLELPLNQWRHLALVYDAGNTARAYIDGKLQSTIEVGRAAEQGPAWASIGFGSNLGGEYWHGRLAHLAVYDRPLEQEHIRLRTVTVKPDEEESMRQ